MKEMKYLSKYNCLNSSACADVKASAGGDSVYPTFFASSLKDVVTEPLIDIFICAHMWCVSVCALYKHICLHMSVKQWCGWARVTGLKTVTGKEVVKMT